MNVLFFYIALIFGTYLLFYIQNSLVDVNIKENPNIMIRLNRNFWKFIFIAIAMIPMMDILTNRYRFGTDYKNYYLMYNNYFAYGFNNFELGTIALFNISEWMGWNFKGFLFLTSVIEMIVAAVAIRRHCEKHVYPLSILFFLTLYFGPSTNIIAQISALSFLIFAYEYMIKEQWVPVTIFCLIATLFHSSAIVCIGAYFLYVFNNRSKIKILSIVVLALGLLLAVYPNLLKTILYLLGPKYAIYSDYLGHNRINTFFYLLVYRSPLYIVECVFCKYLVSKKTKNQFYYLLVLLEISCCIMGISMAWVGRLAYFFSIGHVFLSCELIDSLENKNTGPIISTLFVLYFFASFCLMHFFSGFDGIDNFQLI